MPVTFPDPTTPEPRLTFPSFTASTAFQLGSGIRSYFLATYPDHPSGIVIQISLFSGHVLFACAVGDGPTPGPDNWAWVERKFRTVRKYGTSSWEMKVRLGQSGKKPEDLGSPFPEYAFAGGGVPIWIKGNTTGPIGAVIVSGLPQQEDHQLIHNATFVTLGDLLEPPSHPEYITV